MVQQYAHIVKVSKIVVDGLRRWWSSSWSNSISKQARDLFFLNPRFLGMGNHLGHIGMVSKIVVEGLRRWWSSSWSNSTSRQARHLVFFKPQVFGYGESFGTIFRTLRLT